MAGKGSKARPVIKPKYDSNWDEIDWKKKSPSKQKTCKGCGAGCIVEEIQGEPNASKVIVDNTPS